MTTTTTAAKPSFVYVTFIATTMERVWQALIDPAVMREYWIGSSGPARVNISDWEIGSRWEHTRVDESRQVDIAGTVVELTPPTRMVLSWARPGEVDEAAKHSLVTFDLAPQGQVVKLTVTHSDLEKDPDMLKGVSGGWPQILSNLKTLLETGKALQLR
ncbi:MAG: SRPBCC family protein [Phycisphaerae bacterium]|nr:SRPBCC family protein [Gemmatimonadaceae bacterium]